MPDETPRPDSSFGDGETPRVGPPPTIRGLADDTLRDAPLLVPRPVQPQPAAEPNPSDSHVTPVPRAREPLADDAAPEATPAAGYGTLGGGTPPVAPLEPPALTGS